jgi:hypothetical protein
MPLLELMWAPSASSQSHFATDSESVCLGVEPHPVFVWVCVEVAVLSIWGTLSDERSGLSLVSQSFVVQSHVSIYRIQYIYKSYKILNIQYVQGLCQSRLSTADYALFLVAFATNLLLGLAETLETVYWLQWGLLWRGQEPLVNKLNFVFFTDSVSELYGQRFYNAKSVTSRGDRVGLPKGRKVATSNCVK